MSSGGACRPILPFGRAERKIMAKKLLLIINPVSGKMNIKAELLGIIKVFCEADFALQTYVTRSSLDAVRYVEKNSAGFDVIVACGGDGTFGEVVSGALRSRFEGALGFLPCGTTNDMAQSLSLPKNLIRASRLIAEKEAKPMDFGSFNRTRYFTYVAAFGAFTDVSYSTDQKLKNVFGHAAYISEAIARLKGLRSYRMKVNADGVLYEGDFLFGAAANSLSIGGVMKLKKSAVDLCDGYHEIMLIRNPKTPADLANLSRELVSGNFENKSVLFFRAKKIVFDCDEEIPWCVDGEFAGRRSHAEVRNLHGRLRVIYP